MEFVIGILFTSIASLAILMSIFSFYRLWKLGSLTKDFFKKKGIKFISLYCFWILLFVGGVLMLRKNKLSTSVLQTALIIIIFYAILMAIGIIITYTQFFLIKRTITNEEDEIEDISISNGLKKGLRVQLLLWLATIGISIFLINYL